jgi:hypothetical protein
MSENVPAPSNAQILIYQADSGETRLEVRLQDETVWLTQNLMAELYQTTKQNISLHIQNIYEEGELTPEATVKEYLTVRQEGSRSVQRRLDYYNLDMIIAVGYRVKSAVATRTSRCGIGKPFWTSPSGTRDCRSWRIPVR